MGKGKREGTMGEVIRMTVPPNVEKSSIDVCPNGTGGVVISSRTEGPVTLASYHRWTHAVDVEIKRDDMADAARAFGAPRPTPATLVAAIEAFLTPSERGMSDVLDLLDRCGVHRDLRFPGEDAETR
jgi:hypothetical protein